MIRRFYKHVTLGEQAGGWQVMLDARGVKTVGGARGGMAAAGRDNRSRQPAAA